MASIRAFRAVRPADGHAAEVAALPYDVMNSAEAREMVVGHPYSFLHVDKSEIDLPEGIDLYDARVYEKARDNIRALLGAGVLAKDATPCLYLYRLVMAGRAQSGLVVAASIDDYAADVIKKHELTRADKEADRIRHVDVTDYHTGPIYLTYVERPDVDEVVAAWQAGHAPAADFVADDGIGHTVWVIDDPAVIDRLVADFAAVDHLYIADGHHRAASAVKVGVARRAAAEPGVDLESDHFLAVLFPKNQLAIMDYNRVLLGQPAGLMDALAEEFVVEPAPTSPYRPEARHRFGMYADGQWWKLTVRDGVVDESDPVRRLDVSLLQDLVLRPIFGIDDPRTSKAIDFVGGIRGLGELERRCHADAKVAFALYPTSLDDLIAIANAGAVMPPKSTWFEPKMRSGLFLHSLTEA